MRRLLATLAIGACAAGAVTLGVSAQAADKYALRQSPEVIKAYEGQKPLNAATSEHFALWWGNENPNNYVIDDNKTKSVLEYFEHIRDVYVNQLHFPLRNADGKVKYKSNIYMTETGIKNFEHGWAFGGADDEGYGQFCGDPRIMVPGHNGPAHEFAHSMQAESGGFRDSEYVGWFWECHAQFMAHQITYATDMPHVLDYFTDTAQFDIQSTRHHYGAWIFLQYLAEKPGFGFGFINSLWLMPSVNKDENPISKIIRLSAMKDPAKDWADLFGDFAKRNVTFSSYKRGASYRDSVAKAPEKATCRSRTPLEEIKDKPGWYRIPYASAPQENAYNIIPLWPTGKSVKVTFKGLVDPVRKSDWRVTLVAGDDKAKERFSNTWNSGVGSITLKPNEKILYLVVAATPGVLVPQPFQVDFTKQDRFPYEVKIDGADPKGKDLFPNKAKGLVAATAKVASTAYVAPTALVLGNAQILDNARIEDFAVISGDAVISGNAIVSGHAIVTDKATVSGNARVRDYARLYDNTVVDSNARVFEFPKLQRNTHVYGNAIVRGHTIASGAEIFGNAVFTGGADPGGGIKCEKGIFTGFVGQRECDQATNYGGMLASYNFNSPHAFLVRDSFAAGDGFAHGNPKWTPGALGFLGFNGRDQYAEMPSYLCDLRNAEIEVKVQWLGSKPGERVFDFGRDKDNCMYFTPESETGKGAFVMISGGKKAVIETKDPIANGDWNKVTISFVGDTATLSLNGEVVGTATMPAKPEDLRADSNYLAKGRDGSFFTGNLDSLIVRIKDSRDTY